MLNTAEATPATTQLPARIVRMGKWRLFQLSRIASLCSAEDMAYPPRVAIPLHGMLSRLSRRPVHIANRLHLCGWNAAA